MKKVRLLKPAENELFDAMFYYERQADGLGFDFAVCINEAAARIEKNPEAYPETRNRVRRCLVRRLPFALLYKILPDELLILAVMHLKRHPSYWVSRLS
ncbi:MAG: type II toxin-antitoxin system RelE/ParE family toxin [Chlorobiaceae bacterium]|nr:type II toxin-antitoxin system RelE/ParE family toxin [Chlorobiaceae bacterium]